jgi:two-component system NtrC family response regulator
MKRKKTFAVEIKNRDKIFEELKKSARSEKVSDEILKEWQYFRSLLEITRSINTPRDFNQLLELIVDSAINLSKAERGFLMLFREDGNLEFRVTRNIDKKTIEGEKFKISRGVVNQVLASNQPLFLRDIYRNKKFKITESIEELGLRMVMCVPLKAKTDLLGLIYVDSHSVTEIFSQAEERLFEAFAAQASVAIENSYLYDLSAHDALTKLYNYGYLRTRLEEEINRAMRYKKDNISFLMLDIDNFKSINDSYGHLIGNQVLIKVADLIKNSVRKSDTAARYGGDEFAIIIPEATVRGARQLAERLHKGIMKLRLPTAKETISITSSIGISIFPVEKITDSENIIVEADHALFVAKSKGGNQITVFGLRKDKKQSDLQLIGKSKAIDDMRKTISRLAKTDATILLVGETGTGKELVTKLIHQESDRVDKPFVVVNCGAIPDNLLESELFGYEKGAFTGAYRQHKGKFEAAQEGTLFLDEISELPFHLQVKLLRAIEQKEIDRIGGKSPIKVDVRVIAASNKNVEDEVRDGNFRKDLFYRLSVATFYIQPLRNRPDDIEILTKHYLGQMNTRYRRNFKGFTQAAMRAIINHSWPGNVRELIHRIERAVIMGTGQYLDEINLGLAIPIVKEIKPLKELKNEVEKENIKHALMYNHWNITHTAQALGITRKTLGVLIKKYHIVKPD